VNKWPLFTALLALIVLPGLVRSALPSQSSSPPSSPPMYNAGPVTDYNLALPNSGDVIQFRRGERYNIPDTSVPELGENSEARLWTLPSSHFKKDPMPFTSSDVVVVGTVSAAQTHFSNDRRDIYSEFKITIQDVVKNSANPYLRVGNSVDIQRPGGGVRLPSGKVLTRAVYANSMPQIGGRYLLFLKHDPSAEDYAVLMGYELDGDEVYRLDEVRVEDTYNPQPVRSLRREGIIESQFLARTKSAFLAQEKGGS
jgi:hypothetical protein